MEYIIMLDVKNRETSMNEVTERLEQMGCVLKNGGTSVKNLTDKEFVAFFSVNNGKVLWGAPWDLTALKLILSEKRGNLTVIPAELFLHLTDRKIEEKDTNKNVKPGDTIRIMSDYSAHGFKIGSAATVLKVNRKDDGTVLAFGYCEKTGRCGKRHVEPRDYEVVEDDE